MTSRVTVTLPTEILSEIDKADTNRSRFILEAVRREVERRRREDLGKSLNHPHPETSALESAGLAEWFESGTRDVEELLDPDQGVEILWIPGAGWSRQR